MQIYLILTQEPSHRQDFRKQKTLDISISRQVSCRLKFTRSASSGSVGSRTEASIIKATIDHRLSCNWLHSM